MQQSGNQKKVRWGQVWLFLGLTFGLTYLLNLVLYLTVGYTAHPATGLLLQLQMLLPATVAIALQVFIFRDSALYRLGERPRWFFIFFLGFTAVFTLVAFSVLIIDSTTYHVLASLLIQVLNLAGLVLLVILRVVSGKEAFRRAGLTGGKVWYWIVFGLIVIILYAAMTALNALFGLGQAVDVQEFLAAAAGGQATGLEALPDSVVLLITGVQSVLLAPFLALLIAFGEEYGWRGYLQGELIKLGKVPGLLLVGVIWGLWHAPVIAMGHQYPGHPVLGVFLMVLYTIALAFLLGYAVLRSGSVWLAAFLHGLNNQVVSFLMLMVYLPDDKAFSFPLGTYSLLVWALVVAIVIFLLRRKDAALAPEPAQIVESHLEGSE